MTREILFRGKRKDTNEWIYGFLWIEVPYVSFVGSPNKYFIRVQENHDWNLTSQQDFQVHKKSIGQFIGEYDSDGIKIFEGDILDYHGRKIKDENIIKFRQFGFGMKNEEGITFNVYKSKIIGNIFDNPCTY